MPSGTVSASSRGRKLSVTKVYARNYLVVARVAKAGSLSLDSLTVAKMRYEGERSLKGR